MVNPDDKIGPMSTPNWDDKLHVRTSQHARAAIDRLKVDLRAKRLKFWGKPLTQEALVASLLLWIETVGVERIATELQPQLKKLEALMGYETTGLKGRNGTGGRIIRPGKGKSPKAG